MGYVKGRRRLTSHDESIKGTKKALLLPPQLTFRAFRFCSISGTLLYLQPFSSCPWLAKHCPWYEWGHFMGEPISIWTKKHHLVVFFFSAPLLKTYAQIKLNHLLQFFGWTFPNKNIWHISAYIWTHYVPFSLQKIQGIPSVTKNFFVDWKCWL